jgi:hypothetical protein
MVRRIAAVPGRQDILAPKIAVDLPRLRAMLVLRTAVAPARWGALVRRATVGPCATRRTTIGRRAPTLLRTRAPPAQSDTPVQKTVAAPAHRMGVPMSAGRPSRITTSVQAVPVAASTPIPVRALRIPRLTWAASRGPARTSAAVGADVLMPTSVVAVVARLPTSAAAVVPRSRTSAVVVVPRSRASAVAVVPRSRTSAVVVVPHSRTSAVADALPRAMAAITAIAPRGIANALLMVGS